MNRLRPVLALLMLAGCDRATPDQAPPTSTTNRAQALDFQPIPARLALPARVLQMRLPAGDVGSYSDGELTGSIPLRAVGLNLCQTGWVIQGFMDRDGLLTATPPLHIPLAELPVGPAQIRDPNIADQTMHLDLSKASMNHLRGTIRIVADFDGSEVMRMSFDGTPVGVTTAPGLGPQGCFTTGYYQLGLGDEVRVGPVSAVWDNKRLHYVGLRLTERYGVGVWLVLEPAHRQPQNIIRGDLATVGEKPKRFPFRVVFETRTTGVNGVSVEETPATSGSLTASFTKANPQGPVRIELADLVFPTWDGPLSGQTVDKIRVQAMLVTDLAGPGVPVPSEPTFDQETGKRSELSPSASPRVTPKP